MSDVIGARTPQVGGLDRVTGRQAYVADITLDDVLHVKLVTLPVARARIGAIDDTAACAVPGVRLVMSAKDLPNPMPRFGPQRRDRPIIATGETKYPRRSGRGGRRRDEGRGRAGRRTRRSRLRGASRGVHAGGGTRERRAPRRDASLPP